MIVITELLFTSITTTFLWLPTSPENSSFVLNCLGNDDVIYYDFDYFIMGGYSRKKRNCFFNNLIGKYICHGTLIMLILVCSNIFEIFLTSAVLKKMKKSTASVTSMLSRASLDLRKRYENVRFLCNIYVKFLCNRD